MPRDAATLMVAFCVLLQIFGACSMCNATFTEPFCDPSRPECVDGGGDQ